MICAVARQNHPFTTHVRPTTITNPERLRNRIAWLPVTITKLRKFRNRLADELRSSLLDYAPCATEYARLPSISYRFSNLMKFSPADMRRCSREMMS